MRRRCHECAHGEAASPGFALAKRAPAAYAPRVPYRIPGNDDELDARLDDELAQLDESAAPRPADWRARRRSPYRMVFATASMGFGIAMLTGQSLLGVACGALGGAALGALFPLLAGRIDRAAEKEREDEKTP